MQRITQKNIEKNGLSIKLFGKCVFRYCFQKKKIEKKTIKRFLHCNYRIIKDDV